VSTQFWPLFAWSVLTQPATVVADTTGERAALSCSLGWGGLSQPLRWNARQVRVLLWPVFAWSSWAQPATVEAVTSGEGVALASGSSVGVGSASHCSGGYVRIGCRSGLFHRSAWAQLDSVLAGTIVKGRSDGRDVAMSVNHFAERRTAWSSPLSLVLHKYQLNRREPTREREASRGRTGTRRWRRVSAIDHHQAIGIYSCFREGRNHLD
jgi:hypothetical protein